MNKSFLKNERAKVEAEREQTELLGVEKYSVAFVAQPPIDDGIMEVEFEDDNLIANIQNIKTIQSCIDTAVTFGKAKSPITIDYLVKSNEEMKEIADFFKVDVIELSIDIYNYVSLEFKNSNIIVKRQF